MLAYQKVISIVEDDSVHTKLGKSDDLAFLQTYVHETLSSFRTTTSGSSVGRDCATPSIRGLSVEPTTFCRRNDHDGALIPRPVGVIISHPPVSMKNRKDY